MATPEYFTAHSDDWWVCPCGNDPQGSGHATATADGLPTDSDPTWSTHQTLVCMDCGRYATPHYTELDGAPVVKVRGRVDLDAAR